MTASLQESFENIRVIRALIKAEHGDFHPTTAERRHVGPYARYEAAKVSMADAETPREFERELRRLAAEEGI